MSHSVQHITTIIKSDRTGRTRYSREYKQEVLSAYQASSLSAPQFAAQCGLKYPTFASWIVATKRIGETTSITHRPTFLLAELDPASQVSSASLEVLLPCGAIVRVPSRDQLPLLVELLRQLT